MSRIKHRGVAEERATYEVRQEPISAVGAMLGGPQVLGRAISTELDLAAAVRAGIPTRAVRLVWKKKIVSPAETYAYVVPRRTFEHREKTGRLTPEQSDRLARVLRLTALAERAFGDSAKAALWLRRKTRPLRDRAPLEMLDSDPGAKLVEDLLGRIEHGIAA
jgi:putative toxin-antitoxin system antitoxin component (TIGR02293 family)